MKQDKEQDNRIVLNQWNEERAEDIFSPEIVYHFKDNDGNNWIILLTLNECYCGKEPWHAWLCRCDENWEIISDSPDNIYDLLEEKEHTPGNGLARVRSTMRCSSGTPKMPSVNSRILKSIQTVMSI